MYTELTSLYPNQCSRTHESWKLFTVPPLVPKRLLCVLISKNNVKYAGSIPDETPDFFLINVALLAALWPWG
jgi:hypothetical protein